MNLLREGSRDSKTLDGIRAALEKNRHAREQLGAARLSDTEIRARVSSELDEFCRFGADLLGQAAFAGEAQSDVVSETLRNPRAVVTLLRDQLEPALVTRVIAEAGEVDALSEAERRKQAQALSAERRTIELKEEREVLRLEAEGFSAERRADVDVELLFEVWNAELRDDAAREVAAQREE